MNDYGFKWKIGDSVTATALVMSSERLWNKSGALPAVLFIVERILQECPGGIQRHYNCRVIGSPRFDNTYVKFNEIELCDYPWPEKPSTASDTTD